MGIPRAAVSPCSVLQSIDWEGEQGHLELTLVDARTVFGCHRTRGPGGRERWPILQEEIVKPVLKPGSLGRMVVLLGFWPFLRFLARPPPSVPQALKGPAAARTWLIYDQAAPLGPDVSIGTHFGQVGGARPPTSIRSISNRCCINSRVSL